MKCVCVMETQWIAIIHKWQIDDIFKTNDVPMIIKQVEKIALKTKNMDPWVFTKI